MSERLNLTDLAAEHHLSNGRTLSILRNAGIERDGRKLYDAEDARIALVEAIDPERAAGNRTAGRAGGATSPEITELAAAKVRSEAARAEKLELENRRRAGELVDRATVIEAGVDLATSVRNAILAVPAKVANRLVGKSQPEIVAMLDDELRHALSALADVDNYILSSS